MYIWFQYIFVGCCNWLTVMCIIVIITIVFFSSAQTTYLLVIYYNERLNSTAYSTRNAHIASQTNC